MNLDEEKEKARFVYRLELRKIIVDKMLFGVILVIFGMITNILIENYRSDLTKDQFLLEERLNAIKNIKS